MAGISSKAALSSLSAYKYNAGSELEDEGGLNYYNTFYRKYDAQIGRFTGVDIMAESFAGLTPFQFGNNNPVFFNDPLGDKFVQIKETAWSAPRQNDPHDYLENDGWFDNIGNSWEREAQTGSGANENNFNGGSVAVDETGNIVSAGGIFAKYLIAALQAALQNLSANSLSIFPVTNSSGSLLGAVTVLDNNSFNYLNTGGVSCNVGYRSFTSNQKTNWIQVVTTNNILPESGHKPGIPFIDQTPDGIADGGPYPRSAEWMKYALENYPEYAGFNSVFYDKIGRYIKINGENVNTNWVATLSLVNVNNGNSIMAQFSYGFNIINGVVTPTPISQNNIHP